MNRNETFSGLWRGAVHSSGELLYGIQTEAWRGTDEVPQPATPDPEPMRQAEKPTQDIDIDIHRWLKVRDNALGY